MMKARLIGRVRNTDGIAARHQHRAPQVLLHHRPEHEAEQHRRRRTAELHPDEADDAEQRGEVDLERGLLFTL